MANPLFWTRQGNHYAKTAIRALHKNDCTWAAMMLRNSRRAFDNAGKAARKTGNPAVIRHVAEVQANGRAIETTFAKRCKVKL